MAQTVHPCSIVAPLPLGHPTGCASAAATVAIGRVCTPVARTPHQRPTFSRCCGPHCKQHDDSSPAPCTVICCEVALPLALPLPRCRREGSRADLCRPRRAGRAGESVQPCALGRSEGMQRRSSGAGAFSRTFPPSLIPPGTDALLGNPPFCFCTRERLCYHIGAIEV